MESEITASELAEYVTQLISDKPNFEIALLPAKRFFALECTEVAGKLLRLSFESGTDSPQWTQCNRRFQLLRLLLWIVSGHDDPDSSYTWAREQNKRDVIDIWPEYKRWMADSAESDPG